MTIESSTTIPTNTNLGKRIAKKVFTLTAYTALIAFGVITTITVIGSSSRTPTGTYLSPLPTGEIAQATPTPEPVKTTPELINLAQNYLDKAFTLAKTHNQTQEQKAKILENLDQSLSLTTQAISQDPRNPNGYVLRAQILTAVSNSNPSALAQAQKDLETAQGLSQGQPITLPETINPLNLLPDQQALASSDLILAAPENATESTASGEVASNSFTTKVTIAAGQTELLVTDARITPDSYIYLIPETKTNASIFVKSKGNGKFTLATSTNNPLDLTISYYIINP
jgi:hypothetical protein